MAQKNRTVVDPRNAERRNALLFKIGTGVVLIILIAAITVWLVVKNNNKPGDPNAVSGDAVPTVVQPDGSIRLTGAPKGAEPKAVITIVEDFQCPACNSYEQTMGQTITKLAERPDVAVDYRTVAFLDRNFKNYYSANTMNASLCVAEKTGRDGDMSTWKKFHDSLFANQVEEGSDGLSNETLIELAEDAGAGDISSCVTDRSYGDWIAQQSDKIMGDSEFQGTPWVKLNGKTIDGDERNTPQGLESAVNAAVAGQ
ncbi:DsbA family protein [Gordonia shandongensis]|uniref:DsbA family protein n=1 Tax=Gordonia shandongensis TaxID=376351 RepID=UPI0003FD38D1|nr:thioredoxin domain-containing protein [Gordonia shandongensis]